jgi:hypothetical protein
MSSRLLHSPHLYWPQHPTKASALAQDASTDRDVAVRLAVAGVIGVAIRVEREWLGHAPIEGHRTRQDEVA